MGVYVFSWPLLRDLLSSERIDFGRDILPGMVQDGGRVFAYEFAGYWQDVGTVESYWQTNLDLLGDDAGVELNDLGWLIYTRSEERPPARIGPDAVGLALDDQPWLRDRRHGRAQRPLARRPRGRGSGGPRLDRDVRRGHRGRRDRSIARSSTRSASSAPALASASATICAPTATSPNACTPGSPWWASGPASRAESRSAATAGSTPESTERDFKRRRRIRSGETVVAGVA